MTRCLCPREPGGAGALLTIPSSLTVHCVRAQRVAPAASHAVAIRPDGEVRAQWPMVAGEHRAVRRSDQLPGEGLGHALQSTHVHAGAVRAAALLG